MEGSETVVVVAPLSRGSVDADRCLDGQRMLQGRLGYDFLVDDAQVGRDVVLVGQQG